MNNMTKKLEGIKELPKTEIHIDLLKTTLKNIKLENVRPWLTTWFLVQETHLHSRQTSTWNELIPTKNKPTPMEDKR